MWSFSALTTWEDCPYSFYKKYVCKESGESNFYAANGSLVHEILNRIANGEISLDVAPEAYIAGFELIGESVKQSTMDSKFEQCLDYFACLEKDILGGCEIVESEKRYYFSDNNHKFVGIVDLLLRDKNGDLVLVDHKSSAPFLKKNGEPYANQKDSFNRYKKQMYMYCKPIYEKYGKFPSKIVWNHFCNQKLTIIPFNITGYTETWTWVNDTINKIYEDEDFFARQSYLLCNELCDYRSDCEFKDLEDEE